MSYRPLDPVLVGTTASFTAAKDTKLSGIATAATANSSDATLLARANHTGTQAVATITGLGTLATQSGTFSGTSSGTNTGDQNLSAYAPLASPTFTGTVTLPAATVTLAMQANMATASVIYRKTAAAGAPEVQTLATLKTDLGLTGTNTGDQTTVSGNAGTATALATGRTISITGKAAAAGGAFDGTGNLTINVTAVTLVAGDIPAIAESGVTNLVTDLAAKAPLASPQFTGVTYYQQVAPTAKTATGTLTIAELLTLIITCTSATAVSLTLPTGTLSDAGILAGALAVNEAFEWYVINLGSSTGACTLVAGTAHTIVGSAATAIATSSRWLTRKTATNTFVTYRIA